jgi:hypothetical protein
MTEKSLSATAEELAAMPEDEFLELSRDCDKISSEYDFKSAGIHTLGAGAFGTLAASCMLSGAPNGVLLGSLISIPAAVYVWNGLQDIGSGVRHAAKSASADTALRILYEHDHLAPSTPTTIVTDAEPIDRVKPTPQQTLAQT